MWLRSPTLLSEAPGADPLQLSRIGHLIWHDTLGVCICQGAHGALPAQSHLASATAELLCLCSLRLLVLWAQDFHSEYSSPVCSGHPRSIT